MRQRRGERCFFKQMSENEWCEKGLRLADIIAADRAPTDAEFIATLTIAMSMLRALTLEATADGEWVFLMSCWHRIWYALISNRRCLAFSCPKSVPVKGICLHQLFSVKTALGSGHTLWQVGADINVSAKHNQPLLFFPYVLSFAANANLFTVWSSL